MPERPTLQQRTHNVNQREKCLNGDRKVQRVERNLRFRVDLGKPRAVRKTTLAAEAHEDSGGSGNNADHGKRLCKNLKQAVSTEDSPLLRHADPRWTHRAKEREDGQHHRGSFTRRDLIHVGKVREAKRLTILSAVRASSKLALLK